MKAAFFFIMAGLVILSCAGCASVNNPLCLVNCGDRGERR
jgi:hypothetical protein